MKNIHITLTEFRNESRLLKEISSLTSSKLFDEFLVIALGSDDLDVTVSRSKNFEVQRIRLRSRGLPKNALFQLIKFVEFMIRCFFIVKRERGDVINLHTLALLPVGWGLKKIFRVKLVYDAHELETEKNGLHGARKKISKWVERRFINSCDLVIVVGDNIADWYANEYKTERPLVVKNAPFSVERKRNNLFRKELGIQPEQKILLYQGGLMRARGVQLVLDAFKVRSKDDVVAVFMGYGELETDVKEAENLHNNIRFYPAVKPEVVLDYTSSADIGIHLIQNTCLNHYYCMPNKFFEYTMAGLPIIISNMKEMADAVNKYKFGVAIQDYSPDSINAAVDELILRGINTMSDAAYLFASSNAWEQQEAVMLEGYRMMLQHD